MHTPAARQAPGNGTASGELQCSVTVFLSLCFVLISGLLLVICESARTYGQRLYMQTALDSAMESLFSQYHRPLWNNYRILGLEYLNRAELSGELIDFMTPYFEASDLYPVRRDSATLKLNHLELLTDGGNFEESILEYMPFGMVSSLLRFAEEDRSQDHLSETLTEQSEKGDKASELSRLQEKYQLDHVDMSNAEHAIKQISDICSAVSASHINAYNALCREDANDFYEASGKFRDSLGQMPGAVQAYNEAADALLGEIALLRQDFEGKKSSLGEEGISILEGELAEYEKYALDTGSVRMKINTLPDTAASLCESAENFENEVSEFEEWALEMEERNGDLYDDNDDPDIDEEIREFYRAEASKWDALSLPHYDGAVSVINRKNKKSLDGIRKLTERADLLRLVLPEKTEVPERTRVNADAAFTPDSSASAGDLILLGEYELNYLHYYHPKNKDTLPRSGASALEVEYLLSGAENDYDALSNVVLKLVALREGMNLAFLFGNAEKRQEAETFATACLIATGNPVLIKAFTFFVLGIWALAQAFEDVRTLLNNGRVPMIHSPESWTVEVNTLVQYNGKGSSSEQETHGLDYRDYLRLFLYGSGLLDQGLVEGRMLSRINTNLNEERNQPRGTFDIGKLVYGLGTDASIPARHLFFDSGIVRAASGMSGDSSYSVNVKSFYRYKNKTQ